jgi:putative phosphoesterase
MRDPGQAIGVKIGILSDTHNDRETTRRALDAFRQCGVRTLFHCGDLTAPEMVGLFAGFEVYFVRGNMDRHLVPAIKAAVAAQPDAHWLGKGDLVELDGKWIAITHGDREDVLETLMAAKPAFVFTGHTHRRREQRVGPSRVINPGALGGLKREVRSICILDLATDELEVVSL